MQALSAASRISELLAGCVVIDFYGSLLDDRVAISVFRNFGLERMISSGWESRSIDLVDDFLRKFF
jgi:hypothetical protein